MDSIWSLLPRAYELLLAPFTEFAFMRRALAATLALALSAAPLGVFLTLRRMSLLGDALSHAILPGVALGFMFFGLSLTAMALGGVLVQGLLAAVTQRRTVPWLTAATQASAAAQNYAAGALRNAQVIEAMGMLPRMRQRWQRQQDSVIALQARASRRGGLLFLTPEDQRQQDRAAADRHVGHIERWPAMHANTDIDKVHNTKVRPDAVNDVAKCAGGHQGDRQRLPHIIVRRLLIQAP